MKPQALANGARVSQHFRVLKMSGRISFFQGVFVPRRYSETPKCLNLSIPKSDPTGVTPQNPPTGEILWSWIEDPLSATCNRIVVVCIPLIDFPIFIYFHCLCMAQLLRNIMVVHPRHRRWVRNIAYRTQYFLVI